MCDLVMSDSNTDERTFSNRPVDFESNMVLSNSCPYVFQRFAAIVHSSFKSNWISNMLYWHKAVQRTSVTALCSLIRCPLVSLWVCIFQYIDSVGSSLMYLQVPSPCSEYYVQPFSETNAHPQKCTHMINRGGSERGNNSHPLLRRQKKTYSIRHM